VSERRVWILGYGSLMSWTGLGPQREIVRDAWPARIVAQRAFDKPAVTGMIAMDLLAPPRATLRGMRDEPGASEARLGVGAAAPRPEVLGPGRSGPAAPAPSRPCVIGAMLLHMELEGTTPLARREGYPEPAWRRLVEVAGARGLGPLLADVARATGDDVLA
jgi:hypothetical protein